MLIAPASRCQTPKLFVMTDAEFVQREEALGVAVVSDGCAQPAEQKCLARVRLFVMAAAIFSVEPQAAQAVITAAENPLAIAMPPARTFSRTLAAAADSPHRLVVTLRSGALVGQDNTFKVGQGETVELAISSDRQMMLHLHGYELMTEVGPNRPGKIVFVAKIAGRFPVHQHTDGPGNHRAVFFVEVHP